MLFSLSLSLSFSGHARHFIPDWTGLILKGRRVMCPKAIIMTHFYIRLFTPISLRLNVSGLGLVCDISLPWGVGVGSAYRRLHKTQSVACSLQIEYMEPRRSFNSLGVHM